MYSTYITHIHQSLIDIYARLVFFFFQFSDVATFGNHTQGDLAMFGYIPAMKVEIYSNPLLS